jgi:hypothetical protein
MVRDVDLLRNQYQATGLYTSTKKPTFLKQISHARYIEEMKGEKAINFKISVNNSFKSKKTKICNLVEKKLFLFSVRLKLKINMRADLIFFSFHPFKAIVGL